ncbi:hypothetical protein ECC02_005576 [Trypanosoma cruzi]|uniref:ARM-like helical domain-containing protein n=1 Tax=Trypanosoma cruzi TaxID=5693 RepID=A0A7J6Y3I9_TRYCR|nr:hypothetical protein ECC02_005576 [Trypanosoma cruzi]
MKPAAPKTPSKALKGKTATPNKALEKAPKKMSKCEKFLHELEDLNQSQRWKKVVEMGRAAHAGGEASSELALLLQLSQSGVPYERVLGAMGLCQTNCSSEIRRLLRDPCDRVATLAMMPAAVHLSDNDLCELFKELPRRRLSFLCERLDHKKRLPAVADKYIATLPPLVRSSSAHALLCWASEALLARQNPLALRHFSRSEWYTVVKRLPDFALAFAEKGLKDAATLESASERIHVILNAFRRFYPSVGLKLLTSAMNHFCVPDDCIVAYSNIFPEAVAELVVKNKRLCVFDVWRPPKNLRHETFLALIDSGGMRHSHVTDFFLLAPPKLRSFLYSLRNDMFRNANGSMNVDVLFYVTDPAERRREAMRALTEIAELRTDPIEWLKYLFVLPFPEALEMAGRYLQDSCVNTRAAACASLVKSGSFHPEHLHDILDFCVKRGKENDIVRQNFLSEISGIPPHLWKEDHYPKLVKIVQGAFDSRDASTATFSSIMSLIRCTVRFNTVLADKFLLNILNRGFQFVLSNTKQIPRAVMEHLWKFMLPWLKEKVDKKAFSTVDYILEEVGPSLHFVAESSVPFMKTLLKNSESCVAINAFKVLFRFFRPTLMELLPGLLEESLEWIGVDEVRHVVSLHLQGRWLDRYLVPIQTNGRLGTRKGEWLVLFRNGHCWTAAKQEKYAKSISHNLSCANYSRELILGNLAALRKLYSANVTEALAPFIKEEHTDPFLWSNAIELLGKLDDAASLKVLKDAFNDERVRVAVYAIRRRICNLPTAQIIEELDVPLHSKLVAVQKVALRHVCDAGDDVAYAYLSQLRHGEKMHPNLEAVWLSAMFQFLEKREVWDIFMDVAKGKEYILAKTLVDVPDDTLVEDWQLVNLDKLLTVLLSCEELTVVLAVLERLKKRPLRRDEEVVRTMLHILKTTTINEIMKLTVGALCISSADKQEVASAFVSLRPESRLWRVADTLIQLRHTACDRFKEIAVAYMKLLLENCCQTAVACQLICYLPVKDLLRHLNDVLQRGLLHAGAVNSMLSSLKCTAEIVNEFEAVENQLRQHEHPHMQRIGLAMLESAASIGKWDEKRRKALEVYRNASDGWVSDDAKMVDLPRE